MKLSQLVDINQDIMRCFDMSQIRVNSYLRNYFVLILNRGVFDLCGDIREDKGDDECGDGEMEMNENEKEQKCEKKENGDECEDMYMEMHHIVPKSWYRMKGEKINHGKGNVVYLGVRDYLRAFVLLSYYFASVGDQEMYRRMLRVVGTLTGENGGRMLKNGDISRSGYDDYVRKRVIYHQNHVKRMKYDINYLRKCLEIYGSYDDFRQGYNAVCYEMGFVFKRSSLCVLFRRYLPQEYGMVCKRHLEWFYENRSRK